MPTYPITVGGVTYDIDSDTPLSQQQAQHLAEQQYVADTQGERDHLAETSATPTKDELAQQPTGSMWDGMTEAGSNIGYGLLNTVAHPLDTAAGLVKAQGREFGKAYDEAGSDKPGSTLAALGHGAAGMLPLLGPMAANVGEDLGKGGGGDPRALGRAFVNGSALLGPTMGKSALEVGPGVADWGAKLATENPGLASAAAGAAEGYMLHGGKGALMGAIGVPTVRSLIKGLRKTPEAEAGDAAAGAAPTAPQAPTPKPPSGGNGSGRTFEMTANEKAGVDALEDLGKRTGGVASKTVPNSGPNSTTAAPKSLNRPSRSKAARGKENGYSANDEKIADGARKRGLTGSEVHEAVLKERAGRRESSYAKKRDDAAARKKPVTQ